MPADAQRPDPDREAAAAALAALEAAVRQRRGELAAWGTGGDDLALRLAELARREFVQEPRPVSPRRGLGRVIVFVRRAVYHLFFKWHARAVLQQQNEFNQAASALLAELAAGERETRREVERLRARLTELEERPGAGPGARA
ncbi:MAG: hypothetical protein H6Q03_475 [Acidobacteria bacterium]|jgi:hypothetical protein|nr:hypothetical protein [Acidobacteriota bacterium]